MRETGSPGRAGPAPRKLSRALSTSQNASAAALSRKARALRWPR
ncbi:hypothetical protein [Actinoplanes nipponensis]